MNFAVDFMLVTNDAQPLVQKFSVICNSTSADDHVGILKVLWIASQRRHGDWRKEAMPGSISGVFMREKRFHSSWLQSITVSYCSHPLPSGFCGSFSGGILGIFKMLLCHSSLDWD
jgi:hypothetical protein